MAAVGSKDQNVPDGQTEQFIPGLEKIKDERSELTPKQKEEQEKIIKLLRGEYGVQKDEQTNKSILRLRSQFVHVHGTLGGERAVDAVIAMKGAEMAEHGLTVYILNLNFLKRLQTLALFIFLKETLMKTNEKAYPKIHLKIQEEDADEVDRQEMLDDLIDIAEDSPLFVITDETCKEAERIDEAIFDLTRPDSRFHFWSSSAFAHGTPGAARRYRLATQRVCPPTIKQVMDMIDIDDDDVDITGPHHIPLRRIVFPYDPDREGPSYNIREHLHELPVRLISHNSKHVEQDVWECEACGKLLADYLQDEIGIGKPGLEFNEVFIVGSIQRFESSVSISGLQVSLLDRDVVSEVLFCRRAVRIQDILKTMNKVVVSDSVSMRGVDKKIVIIIPSPREKEQQEQIEQELKEMKDREDRESKESEERAAQEASMPPPSPLIGDSGFKKPVPINREDEEVLYQRKPFPGDKPDGADEDMNIADPVAGNRQKVKKQGDGDGDDNDGNIGDDDDSDSLSDIEEDDFDLDIQLRPRTIDHARMRYNPAAHQSLLRRAINTLNRFDKDMILDLFTDAPLHAVIFHFADDDYQYEPDLE